MLRVITRMLVCLFVSSVCFSHAGCDDESGFNSGGDADSDSDPATHTIVLQNGTNGYSGCIDVASPVPEGSGFDEITPEDELMWVRHHTFVGS